MIKAEISLRTFKMMGLEMSKAFLVPVKQLPRIIFHGLILGFIIAGFWLLDSLKDPVLANIVGIEYQPLAKLFSVFVTLIVVCVYDYLTSLVSKLNLFHLVSGFFGLAFVVLSALLGNPETGFRNEIKSPYRLTGWFAYFVVEAYGSLMVALFWSYTNSIMNLEEAKGAYGLIISIAQIGAIIGSTLATSASRVGISQLFLVGAMQVLAVSLFVKVYHITFKDKATETARQRVRSISEDEDDEIGNETKQLQLQRTLQLKSPPRDGYGPGPDTEDDLDEASGRKRAPSDIPVHRAFLHRSGLLFLFSGFYEGLILVLQHTYTLKLLGISVLFEVVVTVLDYEFKLMGAHSVSSNMLVDSAVVDATGLVSTVNHEDVFANLLGRFGQLTNTLSFLISLFGFSYLVRRFNVQLSLLIFPVFLFVAVVLSNLVPTLSVLFVTMSVLKALIFSLNEPVKELLYQPTNDAIKFKAKAWIDVFGCRLAKAAGSFITGMSGGDVHRLRNMSEIPCIILSVIILMLSWSIGSDFNRLVSNRIIVGSQEQGNYPDVESLHLPIRKGLKPGDVGYDGYDLELFAGVFEDGEEEEEEMKVEEERARSRLNSAEFNGSH